MSGAFATLFVLPPADVEWTGLDSLAEYNRPDRGYNKRGVCSVCHKYMRGLIEEKSITAISISSVTKGFPGMPKCHIMVKEKVDWCDIPDDGLPRFDAMP